MTNKNLNEVFKNEALLERLNNAEINSLEELCSYSKKELENKGIESLYVKDIVIALQCEGLDLKKR